MQNHPSATVRPAAVRPTAVRPATLRRVLSYLAGLLIVKVTASVVLKYRDYFPPDFQSDFLRGRESYFFGSYQWAFYLHIASGPIALLLGLVLIGDLFRQRFPKWHRRLGRLQVVGVLMFVTPSGLWMAYYAEAGPIAALGFALLAIVTAACLAIGWRAAVNRRFSEHRRWMMRGFLLLCSAVVIRILGGLATVMGFHAEWFDQLTPWICWLAPLLAYEWISGTTNFAARTSFPRRRESRDAERA